jgi:hypothetical protein
MGKEINGRTYIHIVTGEHLGTKHWKVWIGVGWSRLAWNGRGKHMEEKKFRAFWVVVVIMVVCLSFMNGTASATHRLPRRISGDLGIEGVQSNFIRHTVSL